MFCYSSIIATEADTICSAHRCSNGNNSTSFHTLRTEKVLAHLLLLLSSLLLLFLPHFTRSGDFKLVQFVFQSLCLYSVLFRFACSILHILCVCVSHWRVAVFSLLLPLRCIYRFYPVACWYTFQCVFRLSISLPYFYMSSFIQFVITSLSISISFCWERRHYTYKYRHTHNAYRYHAIKFVLRC